MKFVAYPLQVKPVFREMIWGGRALAAYAKIPLKGRIGEVLFFCDNPSCTSVINNGHYKGMTVSKYMEKFGMQAVGLNAAVKNGRKFPLLIKFIDAKDNLSVQVHPDEAACRKLPGALPKSELWYIINSAKKTGLYMGLKKMMTARALEKAALDGGIAGALNRVKIKKGDAFFLPAGLVHAIGAGSTILEIQQNSDTTYRLYDWGRAGAGGKPRQLHMREALLCAKTGLRPAAAGRKSYVKAGLKVRPLCGCGFFQSSEISSAGKAAYLSDGRSASVLAFLKGKARIEYGSGAVEAEKGSVVFLPKRSGGYVIKFGAASLAVAAEIR